VKLDGMKGYGVKLKYDVVADSTEESGICSYGSNPTSYTIGNFCLYIDIYDSEYKIKYPNNVDPFWDDYPLATFKKKLLLFQFLNSSTIFMRIRVTNTSGHLITEENDYANIAISNILLTKVNFYTSGIIASSVIEPQTIAYYDYNHTLNIQSLVEIFEMKSNCSQFEFYDGECGMFSCPYPLTAKPLSTTNLTDDLPYYYYYSPSHTLTHTITGVYNNSQSYCNVQVYSYDAQVYFLNMRTSVNLNVLQGYTFFSFNYTSLKNFTLKASSDAGKSNAKIGIYFNNMPGPQFQTFINPTAFAVQNNIGDQISLNVRLINNEFATLGFFSIYTLGEKASITVEINDGQIIPNPDYYIYLAVGIGILVAVVLVIIIIVCVVKQQKKNDYREV
jgi:hypothetical protein